MMKQKRILAAVMCLCISAATAVCSLPEQTLPVSALTLAEPTQSIYDIYMYKNHGDHIEITACSTMASGDIVVPGEIDGLPVTVVGEHGFAGTHVTTIQLPDTVHTIGKQAFAMCAELREVNIPDGVTEIGDEAFLNCTSLTASVTTTLPDSLTSIGVRAFRGCTSLTAVTLPNRLTNLGEMAFGSCTALEVIRIPDGITELQTNTLYQCNKLKTLTLPESVVSVGSATLPDGLEKLTVLNKDCVIDTSNVHFAAERNWVIAAPAGGAVQAFAEQFGYTFAALDMQPAKGDVNGDGELNVLDIVMMQKWILGAGDLTIAQAADFNDDGETDIFDLALLKRELVAQQTIPPAPVEMKATNLMADMASVEPVAGMPADEAFVLGQTKFALSLLQNTAEENVNTLVSPYSAVQALGMTANGAAGNTKTEMEQTIGSMAIEKLNEYLYTQRMEQPSEENCKLTTANSIWFRDDAERITVNPAFLQTNANYYKADAFAAPFDQTTVDDINNWVDSNTDHMIPKLLEELKDENVMCLINAVVFDAKWEEPFYKENVYERDFTAYNGTVQAAKMMYGDAYYYLQDEHAKGFYKYYEGGQYAFAALLPEEGMTVTEYINGLTPESLHETLENPIRTTVGVGIPKFSYDYEVSLVEPLATMGMPTAFDEYNADFSEMAKTDMDALWIGDVLHKTHIDVFEGGTKAAAVTGVIMDAPTAVPIPPEEIVLDRPFVYCIVDTETSLPVFIGTLMEMTE